MNLHEEFCELPPELITKIFFYLTPKDLLNTSKISNTFCEISQRVLKKKLFILKLKKSSNIKEIQELLEDNCIVKLRLENNGGIDWEDEFLTCVQVERRLDICFWYKS